MDVNVDNIIISLLDKTKTISKYFIGIKFDKSIRPLDHYKTILQMSGYVKTFKVKYEYKDTNNKLMSCCIDVEKLLKKYKALSIKIKDLKSITLNTLPVYDDRYGKNKKNI